MKTDCQLYSRYFLSLKWRKLTNNGVARNKEEYVPKPTPNIKAKEKYFKVAPPKKNMAKRTTKVVKEVFNERTRV